MRLEYPLVRFLITVLLCIPFWGSAQLKTVEESHFSSGETDNFVPRDCDVKIGMKELTYYVQDRQLLTNIELDFKNYRYLRDSSQVGIRVPMNGLPNLYLYAFKSCKPPHDLYVYMTQVYGPSTDDSVGFDGDIAWLDFQDFKVRRATYVQDSVVSCRILRDMVSMRWAYEARHDLTENPDPDPTRTGRTFTQSATCKELGNYTIGMIKGADCLFSADPNISAAGEREAEENKSGGWGRSDGGNYRPPATH